ncbi:MAG: AAA family ATPase [Gammaproteobacteria bacterium]|nr:AAA family ATPase [Gammaproteobacteria bacterium]
MKEMKALDTRVLRPECDPNQFTFRTTTELEELTQIIGQTRALEAVHFGVGIKREGYNLYALGPAGLGKHSVIRQVLEKEARRQPTADDWCYVNNFKDPQKPTALRLPVGWGSKLRRDMESLVGDLRTTIPAVFEGDEYRTQMQEIEEELKERQEQVFAEIQKQAGQEEMAILHTPQGFAVAPTYKGEVISAEQFEKLSKDERKDKEETVARLQAQLARFLEQIPRLHKERRQKQKEVQKKFTMSVVGHLIDELKKTYAKHADVLVYLDAVQRDVVENVDDFRKPEEGMPIAFVPHETLSFVRYRVNVVVDQEGVQGAPVIYEDNPSYPNLIGRVEHKAQFGALLTDFTLVKCGALHRANGGYLVLDTRKVLMQPYAWEGLKRVLHSHRIVIESLGQMLGVLSTVSLEPEPIPLSVKVVLIGDRVLYHLLCTFDPEFKDLFKVAADFEERIERSTENNQLYARLIGTMAGKEGLRPLDRTAVARVIDHSARLVGDAEKLSTHMRSVSDLLREADYWAGEAGRNVVKAADVQQAIGSQIRRADRVRERLHEEIQRGTILIDTDGEKTGQVNGLSVIELGDFTFGQPSRITATTRLGKGEVIDIEREVELGGAVHSKGVLILSNFMAARYSKEQPLSLSASLVFEQTYGMVEGDSASVAELCALLSALADVPIKQSLAVTGSVNQHGQVQAIGGVNEKIEGFFDVCKARCLAGDQGVLIPAANVKHLMLRQDIVEMAAAGKFHVYAVETIDQVMSLLTGVPAGERDRNGNFPEGSINQRVEHRLAALAQLQQKFAEGAKAKEGS